MGTAPTKLAGTNAAARYVDSIDPATNEIVAQLQSTDSAEIPAIFARARAAQLAWAAQPIGERCATLRRLRDAIFDARDEIAATISRETGKPRVEAIFAEIVLALDTADFVARNAPKWLRPERVPHHNIAVKAKSAWLEYEPLGVVAVISPWNYPFAIPIAQVIPALAAANAVVLKPSELTPATGALIGEIGVRANLPENLVQIVQGGAEVGSAMIEAAPHKMFFTGSVETGRQIAQACARKLIPSVLELGGKDPMIVLADADLEIASSAAVWGAFMNCGQACLSVERVYVEQSVAARFAAMSLVKTKKLRLGPPSDPDAEIGPMIRLRQIERVERQLQDAAARGAKILTGGERRPELGPNFFEPAVVTDVDHSMELMLEETFGPVLAICSVASAAEAVAMANDSPFSLSASVWTRDAEAARKIASQLRAGSVMINDVASYYGISEAPHGGRGASGWGRAHSRFGFLEMVHVKYVDSDRLPRIAKSWWYGYSAELAAAAGRFVETLFAPSWTRRMATLRRSGALIFRRDRI
ncbi:MAG TPA: aldehyde dehydrogenase family protein [Candidatus Acidoferrales bacterium]|jgi:succinate-semialdehyde dehydrogenase/glutarate-semialdehyde dehydrogenase|nr:aldehyde dehydrogenase family protein [Candidatus Acidoferrales bacterium]